MNKTKLCEAALKALENSYSPYSNYMGGAAQLCKNGKIYTGCNIENSAFSPTICAERTAFAKAVSEGERDFEAIAVAGGLDGQIKGEFSPCGVCRQVMAEFCDNSFKILLVIKNGEYKEYTLGELLPDSFDLKSE